MKNEVKNIKFSNYVLNKGICQNIKFKKFKSEYRQPGFAKYDEFKYGLFDCCDSFEDCLLAFLCPSLYAYCSAKEADQGFACAFLQCFFYPCGMCLLRKNVRKSRAISVTLVILSFWNFNLKDLFYSIFLKGNLLTDCVVGNCN